MYNYLLHLRTFLIIRRKQLLNIFSRSKETSYIPFAILSEPRSGSTLLHTYLSSHPQIKSYGEILRENIEKKGTPKCIDQPLETLVFKPHTTAIKTVGLKLFYDYYKDARYADSFYEIIKRKDVRIIHLVRKDSLKLYASLQIAKKTNVWSSTRRSTPTRLEKLTIDCHDYLNFVRTHAAQAQLFAKLFKDHFVLKITYEDLSERPQHVLEDVQKFLNVAPRLLFTLLKKQNTDSLETLIANYDEVKKLNASQNIECDR